MLKAVLIFLLIALLGANAAIYLAHRGTSQAQAHAAAPAAQVATPQRPQADAVSPPERVREPSASMADAPSPNTPATAPAATKAYLPTVTPHTIVELAPMEHPRLKTVFS